MTLFQESFQKTLEFQWGAVQHDCRPHGEATGHHHAVPQYIVIVGVMPPIQVAIDRKMFSPRNMNSGMRFG